MTIKDSRNVFIFPPLTCRNLTFIVQKLTTCTSLCLLKKDSLASGVIKAAVHKKETKCRINSGFLDCSSIPFHVVWYMVHVLQIHGHFGRIFLFEAEHSFVTLIHIRRFFYSWKLKMMRGKKSQWNRMTGFLKYGQKMKTFTLLEICTVRYVLWFHAIPD